MTLPRARDVNEDGWQPDEGTAKYVTRITNQAADALAKARVALEPFARAAQDFVLSPNTLIADGASITEFFDALHLVASWQTLTVGDFRRALTALSRIKQGKG